MAITSPTFFWNTPKKRSTKEIDEYYKRFELWAFASENRERYLKGARVWIPHPEKVWEGARVLEDFTKSLLKVVTDDGEVRDLKIASDSNLPPLRNPDILIGGNDLTSLSYLHEPAVLYNLQVRFCRENAIYTYCGIVLVAINPYTEMPIYGSDTIWTYRGRAMGELEPHIFAVAEEAYTKMEREQSDQSIIVSGESGAGKTVSAKYAMRYFATVGGSTTETHVERKVLASSPIMEAIGNAKTIRNDNSSRFGKYIELHFTRNYTISGASMRTYLLEKSRVVFQAQNERNYHIFYQLCAAREKNPDLMLQQPGSYIYLSDESEISGVDDGACYEETLNALITLGFTLSEIKDIFTILAGILQLGNISIVDLEEDGDSEVCTIPGNDMYLEYAVKLFQVSLSELRHWLCHRQIVSSRETLDKPMNVTEAIGARDALAKHIYAALFSWIVGMINRALKTNVESKHKFIGVLDIYGFETFEANSFEQFCINYANEKLQQQFNQHVFKLEQEEYLKENIEWKFIDFYDNQPCIDLIESKLGVLDLLDEECRMPKGSDSSWADKLYSKCTKYSHFVKPRFGTSSFLIKHFADKVDYDVSGFLEKNRDTVIEEQVNVLRNSNNRLLHRLFKEHEEDGKLTVPKTKVRVSVQPKSSTTKFKNKKTVGSQFRDSLNALMSTLNATTPHYIRCIKPNDEKAPFKYNPNRAVQQLRACGVLETIRISAAGFPSRWLYSDFLKRYRSLCKSRDINRENMRVTCEKLVGNVIKDGDKYKFGKTKIFFRAGQVAYLERLRSERLLECCIKIQTAVRGFLIRRHYTRTLRATNTLQRYMRGFLARRRVEMMRRNKAATTIQRFVRGWVKRKQYKCYYKTALGLQKYCRGFLARRKFENLKRNHAAVIIQAVARRWMCQTRYLRIRHKIIIAQSAVRRFLARRKFRLIKREARSAEHLKKLNKGLENKIISLQQKLGEITKENLFLKAAIQEAAEARAKLDSMRGIEVELKKVSKQLNQRNSEIETLRDEILQLKECVAKKEKISGMQASERKDLMDENKNLKNEMLNLKKELENVKCGQEEELRNRILQEKTVLQGEYDQERHAYQKLLAEKDVLENRVESLEKQLQTRPSRSHIRNPSDVSITSTQEDDFGYDSIRSPSNSGRDDTPTPDQQMDIGLVLKLQQKLRALESENHRLHGKVEAKKGLFSAQPSQETFIVQELEIENAKLKADVKALRDCIANDVVGTGNSALQEITKQLELRENEITRLKDENIQLRNAFANRTQSTKTLVQSSYSACQDLGDTLINEDGELVLAYEAQKKVIRQQAEELEQKTMHWEIEREELVSELERLREETEKYRVLLSSNVVSCGDTFLHHEITRLSAENLDLQEKYDMKSAKCRKLQEQILFLKRKLKDAGVDIDSVYDSLSGSVTTLTGSEINMEGVPVVKKKEREYMGMFEIKYEDLTVMIKHITELKPRVAISLLPGLPSYIIFMCVRYTDYINHERMLQALMLIYNKAVNRLIRRRMNDLELCVLWLSNTVRLIHNLKQYSGEPHFAKENTQTQNEQCLKNFDLSDFRLLMSDLAIWIFQNIMKTMEDKLQPLAVPAILEHEAISGLTVPRGRSASVTTASTPVIKKALDELLAQLTSFHRLLSIHGIDPELICQFFKQVFYFLCASSLNNLLLRKEFCHWSKGMQIRYNLSHLEQWAREQKLQDQKIFEMLAPIIQASQLLQARKTDADVDSVAEMCSDLTPNQIVKLLNLYTPADDLEARVPEVFIEKIQLRLKEQRSKTESTLLMDTKFTFSIDFPFNPSSIRLEDIEIPPVLNLPMLKKI